MFILSVFYIIINNIKIMHGIKLYVKMKNISIKNINIKHEEHKA